MTELDDLMGLEEELQEPEIVSFEEKDTRIDDLDDNNLYNRKRNKNSVFEAGDRFYSPENML